MGGIIFFKLTGHTPPYFQLFMDLLFLKLDKEESHRHTGRKRWWNTMVRDITESEIINKLIQLVNTEGISGLEKIEKGSILKGKRFKETIEKYYRRKLLWPLIEADLIFVFEDWKNIFDRNLIVALEIKYFTEGIESDLEKQLRQAYREFGQPLRNLVYGFDSIVLWHIFHESIEDKKIDMYANTVSDTIKKLDLPMLYFGTKFSENRFKFYQPWSIDYQDLRYLIECFKSSCREKRNPLKGEEIKDFRNAIKVALGIP